jgi:hypothetical protein
MVNKMELYPEAYETDIYTREGEECLIDDDSIDVSEAGFMQGYRRAR